ncbi:MAG TPA: Gfo/Idh/MocA family oxidoreductase [Clostridiaceae bacterium]|jgi:scyllo-inositol 2-dehydrogenase (NADP+)|nr:Gfo/Idh/MocA family oxidoreductase [Clostridiaceae bacterium]
MKLAIVGYGGMGAWHHENIRARIPEIEVVGAYDIREERQEEAKKQGLRTYNTFDELVSDDSIDIVTIATPNNFHKKQAIRCLESGKHVICEKPVTMNADELEEIIEVAKKCNKVFTVHQNRRWDRDFVMIKNIVESNTIGKPYMIESRVLGSKRVLNGWRGAKENGGGMVFDWGVHLIDQILYLTDSPVVEIYGHLFSIFSKEVDDNFKALFKFENGLSAMIEVATNCFIPQARWHMSCEDGTAIIHDWSCNGTIIKLKDESELAWSDVIVYTEAGPTRTMAPRPRETTEELPLPEVTTDWSDYYRNVIDHINGKADLIVKPEQSLRVMKVIDAIFESHRTQSMIKCRI